MSELNIPEGVLNKEAYLDFIEMQEAFNKSEEKQYKTSLGTYIDFSMPTNTVRKASQGLPNEEREYIENISHKYMVLQGLLNIKRKEAFTKPKTEGGIDTNDVLKIRQAEILELFGQLYKVSDVLKIVQRDWGFTTITRARLERFVNNNLDKIKELQEAYVKDYNPVRLVHKRSRLEELSYLYVNIKNQYEETQVREDAKILQSLLESIKKEVDGDMVLNINANIQIEQNIQLQIQNEAAKQFNITALIINKMAGRMNVNPNFIVSRLANSHYAKFTGFKPLEEGENRMLDEIYSPTGIVYDLNDIENKNIEIKQKEDKLKKLPIIAEDEAPKVLSIRDLLKQKLQESNVEVERAKNSTSKKDI